MIRMLIGCQLLTVISIVVGVVGFDEAILREITFIAVSQELIIGCEQLWLMLQQVHNFDRRTRLVVVVDLGCASGAGEYHPLINAQPRLAKIEDIHTGLSEGSAVVREGAVANRWTGNGSMPRIKDGEIQC